MILCTTSPHRRLTREPITRRRRGSWAVAQTPVLAAMHAPGACAQTSEYSWHLGRTPSNSGRVPRGRPPCRFLEAPRDNSETCKKAKHALPFSPRDNHHTKHFGENDQLCTKQANRCGRIEVRTNCGAANMPGARARRPQGNSQSTMLPQPVSLEWRDVPTRHGAGDKHSDKGSTRLHTSYHARHVRNQRTMRRLRGGT